MKLNPLDLINSVGLPPELLSKSSPPLPDEIGELNTVPPLLPPLDNKPYGVLTKIEPKEPNYASYKLLDELGIGLGMELLGELPYEDNGRITIKDLISFLSKQNITEMDYVKTDEQIIGKQIELLYDMKKEAKTASQDGQTSSSRHYIAETIRKKIDTFDELANKASFNNRPLNKVENDLAISLTRSDNIGNTRFATGANILEPSKVSLSFLDSNNKIVNIKEVEIGAKHNTGLGALSEAINDNYDKLNIKASWVVESTGNDSVKEGDISNFEINGIRIGTIREISKYDGDGKLLASINNLKDQIGVQASTDARGHLVLTSMDGRGIVVKGEGMEVLSLDTQPNSDGSSPYKHSNYGRLTLVKSNSNDIKMVENKASEYIGFSKDKVSESTINLRAFKGSTYNTNQSSSIGTFSSENSLAYKQAKDNGSFPSSVITYQSAIMSDKIFDSSILQLQEIRNILNANKQTPIYEEAKTNKGVLVSKNV